MLRLLFAAALLTSCSGTVDRFVRKDALPELMAGRDLELACSFGVVATPAVQSVTHGVARESLVLTWLAAGVCAELEARETELQSRLALRNLAGLAEGRAAVADDARLRARRQRATAARRFQASYVAAAEVWGTADDGCPRLSADDQQLFLVGQLAAVLALVNDSAAGGTVGVPLNTLVGVARASECIDDGRFWSIPTALRGATWATVPGSGPADADPWAMLQQAAVDGDAVGQGLARALLVFTAANAGREDVLRDALAGRAPPVAPSVGDWPLLDEYARSVMQFEADQLWIEATGHRAPDGDSLPAPKSAADDPFETGDAP